MITIEEALNLVKSQSKPLIQKTIKPIEKSGGYLLFEDVLSPINMPPFRQSAMDGYALQIHNQQYYKVVNQVKAGDSHQPILKKGEAVRIFTGAAVPHTANAVIMQEKTIKNNNSITLTSSIAKNINIRSLGEQIKAGDIALKKHSKLTAAAIGYLSALGIKNVPVFKKPTIAILTTGNELMKPGEKLTYGKIYESNSKMLLSALWNLKFYDVTIHKVEDNYQETVNKLKSIINNNDLIIITGGISVGDYDYVGKALNEIQVQELFYKVKQKPGKPLFFGKKDHSLIFALPGNPAAALTCFYMYVYVALQKMTQQENITLPRINAKLASNFNKKGDRPQFLKAIYKQGKVNILEGQSSAMLQTFALSNALVFIPDNVSKLKCNDTVETILLPV